MCAIIFYLYYNRAMRKKTHLLISLFLITVCVTGGYFLRAQNNSNQYSAQAATVSNDEAAWHIEANAHWDSAPTKDVKSSYFSFKTNSQELVNITIGKNSVNTSFNCINCPSSYSIQVKNNGFTNKKINYSFQIKFRGQLIKEISQNHTFKTAFSDDFSSTINLSGNQVPVYTISIQNINIKNYSNICTSFTVPTSNPKMPYINNQTYKDCPFGKYSEIPVSTNTGEMFLGYQGSISKKTYYNEELTPSDISYDSGDNGSFIPCFGQPVITEYPLHLYYDRECQNPYPDDKYKSYKVDAQTDLPVIENTYFIKYNGWLEVINGVISDTPAYSIPKGSVGEKTFVANSSKVVYKVTLNTNGATSCPALTQYVSGETTTLPVPSRNGFNFGGWYSNPDFSGSAITAISSTEYGDKTFYAKWNGINYKVTLVLNHATSCDPLTTYTSGIGATLPIPTRDGYKFAGWYLNENLSGSAVSVISASDYGDKTFYAKWSLDVTDDGAYRIVCRGYLGSTEAPFNVKVKFYNDSDQNYYTSNVASIDATDLNDQKSFICDVSSAFLPTRICFEWQRDYKFGYVVRTSHSSCDVYYKGNKIDSASFNQNLAAGATSSTAKCPEGCTSSSEKNKQYIKKNAESINFSFANNIVNGSFFTQNGKKGPELLNRKYLLNDGSFGTISYTKPQLIDDFGSNLELQGFYDINANNKFYDADLNPTSVTSYSNGLILYPGFKQSLDLISNGGVISSPKTTYLAGLNNALPTCEKTGYTFLGWCINEDLSGNTISNISSTEKNPLTLYAKYAPISYKVNVINSVTGELEIENLYADYDSFIDKNAIVENIAKEWDDASYYYTYKGLYTSLECNVEFNFNNPVTGETNIYIGYTKVDLVSYHLDNFVKDYMHPEIPTSDHSDTGMCRGDFGYFALAKEAFNSLSDVERETFFSSDKYASYAERLTSWALANGEYYDTNTFNIFRSNYLNNIALDINNSNLTLIVVLGAIVSISCLNLYLVFIRKKH